MSARRPFRGPSGAGPRDREAAGRDVDEELAFHLGEMEDALVAEGMLREQARAEARRRFGDLERTRVYCVDQQTRRERSRGMRRMIDELTQDLTLAFRTLRRSPGYTAVVVLTLAVGIAAGTVVFSILNPYFLRPLPFAEPDRLVQLGQVDPRYGWDGGRFSLRMLADYEAGTRAFDGIAAYHYGQVNLTGEQGASRVGAGWLTGDMFGLLGVDAALGRTFGPADAGDAVAVIAHGLWQRRWGADPGVVGRTIEIDGRPHTVLGVMAPGFNFPYGEVQLWTPVGEDLATEERGHTNHIPVGRLADGWTRESARGELEGIQRGLAATHPDVDGAYAGVSVKPLREALNFAWDELRFSLGALLGAVMSLLAIACVNVAGLSLARAQSRVRDAAVRAALGAGRTRLVRHLVAESVVLGAAGGAVGIALAWGLTRLLDPLVPDSIFKVGGVTLDGTVLAFSVGVTVLTVLVFGLAPALRLARTELAALLRSAGGGTAGSTLRGRRALVVAEIALAVVLVAGTGLMIRSVIELERTDVGFDARRMLTVEATPPQARYDDAEAWSDYFGRAAEGLSALPGVRAVGQVYPLPMNHESFPVQIAPAGEEPGEGQAWPVALVAFASPDYFAAAGIPLLAGRTFDATDRDGPPTVVVGRRVARTYFFGEDPVGRTLVVGDERTPMTVVGVVGDVFHAGFEDREPDPMIYRSLDQVPRRRRFLVAGIEGAPGALAGPAREVMRGVDPELDVAVRPMIDVVRENTFQWTLSSAFLAVFGLVAVFLASLGIYGLVAYSVAQRRRELGVRMALGAGRRAIGALVVGEGVRLAAVGATLGVVGALILGTALSRFLYGVDPRDPATLGAVLALFSVVVLAATALPALRATRVQPVRVLREE